MREVGAHLGQVPLISFRELVKQHIRNGVVENRVAEKLEPLVGAVGHRRRRRPVAHRLPQQLAIRESVAEQLLQLVDGFIGGHGDILQGLKIAD